MHVYIPLKFVTLSEKSLVQHCTDILIIIIDYYYGARPMFLNLPHNAMNKSTIVRDVAS